jgi:hypothetical protein
MTIPRKTHLLAATSLLFIACALYIPHLSATIRYDEAITYLQYAQSPIVALLIYEQPNNHLLHSFLVWCSTSLLGGSTIAIRFPAFAAGLLTLALAYRFGSRLGGRTIGAWALALLAISFAFAEYVVNARGFTLSALLGLVVVERVYFGEAQLPARRRWLLFITCLLLVITLPSNGLLIVAILVWRFLVNEAKNKQAFVVNYALPTLMGSGAGALFYTYSLMSGGVGETAARFGYARLDQLAADWLISVFSGFGGILLAVGVVVGVWILWRDSHKFLHLLVVIVLTALVLAAVQAVLTQRVFFPRNYYYLAPLVVLLAAFGWCKLLRPLPRTLTLLGIPLLMLIGGLALQPLSDPTEVDRLNAAIATYAQEGDLLLIGCCLDYPIYYLRGFAEYFEVSDQKQRVVVLPTAHDSVTTLLDFLREDFDQTPCQPAAWDSFALVICPYPAES